MDPATQPPKRVRFDNQPLPAEEAIGTPMSAAKNTLSAHCASLQPEIASLMLTLGTEFLLLRQKELHKKNQVTTLSADPELIPRSARVKFALSCSKLAEADAGYIRLKEETEALVATFQSALKTKILAVADLEVKLLREQIQITFANNILVCCKALLICDGLPNENFHKIVNSVLQKYSMNLLPMLGIGLEDFRTLYCKKHSIPSLPDPVLLAPVLPPLGGELGGMANVGAPPTSAISKFVDTTYSVIQKIFGNPWQSYLNTQKRIEITTALKSLRTEHLVPSATDAAAIIVDNEPAVEPPVLRAIIDSQVAAKTAKLQNELTSLRSQVSKLKPASSGKNLKRGSTGASQKKKKAAAADGPAPATSDDSAPPKKKPSKPTSNAKSQPRSKSKRGKSRTRNNNASTPSGTR